jgi:hypothetical protein
VAPTTGETRVIAHPTHHDSRATGVSTGRHHPTPDAGCACCSFPMFWHRNLKTVDEENIDLRLLKDFFNLVN